MLRRRLALNLIVASLALIATLQSAEVPRAGFDHVEVAPAKTSLYLGSATLTLPAFSRHGGHYTSFYAAKVFPYFFYNETGHLQIEISDEALQRLAQGEPIDFQGRAERADGAPRRVSGRATPLDPHSGKIKVRVTYSPRIELIFNTTYRFAPPQTTDAAPPEPTPATPLPANPLTAPPAATTSPP